ncbi:MAG: hypothetical protein NTX59_08340 [Elusimicrobia bacterium]|nr:hypothetical protein [Elusimicrobiota bacterium]
MATLYCVTLKYRCGHTAFAWTSDQQKAHHERRLNKNCDLCSGRLARIMKAKKS